MSLLKLITHNRSEWTKDCMYNIYYNCRNIKEKLDSRHRKLYSKLKWKNLVLQMIYNNSFWNKVQIIDREHWSRERKMKAVFVNIADKCMSSQCGFLCLAKEKYFEQPIYKYEITCCYGWVGSINVWNQICYTLING